MLYNNVVFSQELKIILEIYEFVLNYQTKSTYTCTIACFKCTHIQCYSFKYNLGCFLFNRIFHIELIFFVANKN